LSIKTKDKDNRDVTIFYDAVKLSPLWKKVEDYSFYGTFTDRASLNGELFYNPERNTFKVSVTREGKKVLETEYPFQVVTHKVEGDYDLSFIAVGRWAEIHVVHRRHMAMLLVGGIIAALGLIMRGAFRPQRIWLEETADGCRARAVGRDTKKRLKEMQAEGNAG
jgi:cytochrome c biogenesis protein ResB